MFKAKREIWFRRRQKTASILFRQIKKRHERGGRRVRKRRERDCPENVLPIRCARAARRATELPNGGLCGIALSRLGSQP
jgi:hypothetical protein